MSLPRFMDRILDATAPVVGGLSRPQVREFLSGTSVTLHAGERATEGPMRDGFLLAANLTARLFPRIRLRGPEVILKEASTDMVLVNPVADISSSNEATDAHLFYGVEGGEGADAVSVFAHGWNVTVDTSDDGAIVPTPPAALVAAALGVAELFRIVFAGSLGSRARTGPQPGGFNLVTLGEPDSSLPAYDAIEVGSFNLIGAGAIGQAVALTLAASGVRGTMQAVDPERISLSNLQRYVLARDSDTGTTKVDLLSRRIGSSDLQILPIPMEWRAMLVQDQAPTLVALDSAEDRIAVQASLPGPIFNAWTQPGDIGWSRHEDFGEDPCLACLYWPEQAGPSRHEQVASAFRQHPLRVLGYLVHRGVSIGSPLPLGGVPELPGVEMPAEAREWTSRPLLDDIAAVAGVSPGELAEWRDQPLADVYQDGICGGALLHLDIGQQSQDLIVPLAHQSALAGIMLATEFIIANEPHLARMRPAVTEARYDVLSGLPQVLGRPRLRTKECLCGDSDFLDVYRRKVRSADGEKAGSDDGRGTR